MNNLTYIDTHCHLSEPDFSKDCDQIVQKIKDTGVQYVLLPNVDALSIDRMINFEKKYPHLCRSMIGIHPDNVIDDYKSQISILKQVLEGHCFIGIGEIGLDYYEATQTPEIQKNFLKEELEIAKNAHLPISMHVRNSFDDAIKVLKDCQDGNLTGVIHCFSGTVEHAQQFIDLGFSLGIGGIVTFKKSTLPEVLKFIPMNKIVLETDSPYLAPVPFRGKRNDSSFLPYIAEKLAEIYNTDLETVASITTSNAKKIFNLK